MNKNLCLRLVKRCAVRLAAASCLGLVLPLAVSAQPAGRQVLAGQVPAAVAAGPLSPVGVLPAGQRLQLAIALPLRDQAGLSSLLQQLYDPASPNFHHYLTPEQFARQFGPSAADYAAVRAFAEANGLTVTATHPNRVLLDVSGSVTDIERALHVTLHTYRHPTENRTFYAPDTEPSLDLAVPVLHISGLDNYSLPRPRLKELKVVNGQAVAPNLGSGPGGGYMGNDFRKAYVPGSTLNGSGQSVGLLQFDGYSASDITYYENLAGLPNVPLQNVLIDGASGLPSGSGGEVEVSLDIEMAISMATNLSQVIVYMAPNPSPFVDLLSRMANDNLAKQLSCSWFVPNGSAEPAADLIFQQMAAQGQSFFNASGDFDAYTGLIDFPGDTPYITEVGGTMLTTGGGGAWASETVWNRNNGIGSGGGISTQYLIPTWQRGIRMTLNQGSTVRRNIPDVALTAENVYVRADGVDRIVGGTSCAAPLWGGFAALINQQAAANSQPSVGFINPAVYAIGKGTGYHQSFHDINTGNNTSPSSPSKFIAVPGYDLCTGWGTPTGTNFINAIVKPPDALQVMPTNSFSTNFFVGQLAGVISQNYTVTNISGSSFNWSLVNTSLWLNASISGGAIAGGGSTNVTVSLNATAASLPVGNYDATLVFNNLDTGASQSRQATLQVLPLVLNGDFETGDFTSWSLSGNLTNTFVTGNSIFVHSGAYAARLGAVGSLGYLTTTAPTVPGQNYILSLWVENPDGGLPNEFNVSWNGNVIYDQINLPEFGWTNLQFEVTATGSSSTLQFGVRNDPQFFNLDDISLTINPPPAFHLVSFGNNQLTFSFNTLPAGVYQVQASTNLVNPNWLNLGGPVTAADFTLSVTDNIGPDLQKFYRFQVLH